MPDSMEYGFDQVATLRSWVGGHGEEVDEVLKDASPFLATIATVATMRVPKLLTEAEEIKNLLHMAYLYGYWVALEKWEVSR